MSRLSDFVEGPCYVIQVYTGSEEKAKTEIETFMKENEIESNIMLVNALAEKIVFRERKREVIRGVLFPGYLFVFGEMSNEVYATIIRNSRVFRFLKDCESGLLEVPKEKWHLIGELCNEEGVMELLEVTFDENDRVVILSEPFVNVIGKVIKVDRRKRAVIVELNIMGCSSMRFNYKEVEKILDES